MKKVIILILFIITVSSALFFSCKKGPEDPSISFRSRKARVTGTWKVNTYTVNDVDSLTSLNKFDSTSSSCGNLVKEVKDVFEYTYDFNKTGDYTITSVKTTTVSFNFVTPGKNCSNSSVTYTGAPVITKGKWDF